MLINGEQLIEQQLSLTAVTEVTFPDGRHTVLHPVTYLPQLANKEARLSLEGDWQFTRWPFSMDETQLVSMETSDLAWETVNQPGKVFIQGTESGTAQIPGWDRVGLSHIDPEDSAVIRQAITIPTDWQGKRIYLTFDGIYPGGRVYLNGELLGEHTSGLTPVEWDVTGRVQPGKVALVAVRLLRRHPFVKMDMPRHACEFAGLTQPAYFHATECCQIADYHLAATLDDSYQQGTISGTVSVRNSQGISGTGDVVVCILDADQNRVAKVYLPFALEIGESIELPVSLTVPNVLRWNDEFPHLYTVSITLNYTGQPAQTVSYRTGFRRFELKNERPYLNGTPVKFRGVNHLTYHPEHGLYTPEAWLRQNLQLMKKANVNCIRTHYLGPRWLADLCDELGIYLMQELPIDWGTNYIHDPEWVGPALQRLQGGILRDRHHVSVMVWSVGNENMPESLAVAKDGHNHLRIYDRFTKLLDPTRPTMFPPPGPANKITGIFELRVGDIADTHYSFKLLKSFQQTGSVVNPIAWTGEMETSTRAEALARGWSGVWFSSEYGLANLMPDLLHAPYGDIISDVPVDSDARLSTLEVFTDRLAREWGYMRNDPTCLGGAYFPWLCSATGNNPWGWTVWAEDNDWGVVTADLLPKPFFWALRVLFSPVSFPERVAWHKGQDSITVELTNQYNALDLKDCTIRTMMSWAKGASTRSWQDIPFACPPGDTRMLEIPLWNKGALESLERGIITLCRVVLLDPTGFRPLTTDILIVPEEIKEDERKELLIGPDAKL